MGLGKIPKELTIEDIEESIRQWHIRHKLLSRSDTWFKLNFVSWYKSKFIRVEHFGIDKVEVKDYEADTVQNLFYKMHSYYANLCDTCEKHICTCDMSHKYGKGIGKDNIVSCDGYHPLKGDR